MKVGVIGGGQLGRMLSLAGTPLGMQFTFLDPAVDACAAAVGEHLLGGYDSQEHLQQLAQTVDLVTFEFESGDRLELHVASNEYGYLVEGDMGKLTFQGTRYKNFERTK